MSSRDWSRLQRTSDDTLNDIINTNITYPRQIAELEQVPQHASISIGLAYPQTLSTHYPIGQQPPAIHTPQASSPVQPFPAYTDIHALDSSFVNQQLQPHRTQLQQRIFAFQPLHNISNNASSLFGAGLDLETNVGQWGQQQNTSARLLNQVNEQSFLDPALNSYIAPIPAAVPAISDSYAQVLAQPTAPIVTRASTWNDDALFQFINPVMCAPSGMSRPTNGSADFPPLLSGPVITSQVNHVLLPTGGHTMNMPMRTRRAPRACTPSVVSAASKRTSTPRSRKTSVTIFYCKHAFADGKSCGKSYKTGKKLEYHARCHDPTYRYACADCEMYFKAEAELTHHRKNVHTGANANLVRCPQCNKGFLWQPYLDRHLLTHSGAKPFKCLICDNHRQKRFDNLQRHYRNTHPSSGMPKKEDCYVAAASLGGTLSGGSAETDASAGSYSTLYVPHAVEGANVHLAVPQ